MLTFRVLALRHSVDSDVELTITCTAGADPGFDEAGFACSLCYGSDKRLPKAVALRGVREHAPPENF